MRRVPSRSIASVFYSWPLRPVRGDSEWALGPGTVSFPRGRGLYETLRTVRGYKSIYTAGESMKTRPSIYMAERHLPEHISSFLRGIVLYVTLAKNF